MCKKWIRSKFFALGTAALCVSGQGQAAEPTFDVSGSWRLRFEALDNPIFPTEEGARTQHNQRLSSRVLLKGEMSWNSVDAVVEIEDSRAWLDNNDPTLTASQVNTLEPLQVFVRYSPEQSGYIDDVTMGRVALDHGSRRLVSKGVFRNAINNFDGVFADSQWQNWHLRAFYLLPVSRLPSDKSEVADNARAFDKSYSDRRFFGLFAHSDDKQWNLHSYWLNEEDSPKLATKNRDLYTLGVEFTDTLNEVWLANIEVIGQTGTARQSSSPADTMDLDHRAWLVHASLGRGITANTVLKGELDLVSGDNDRSDNTIHDFDSLYGVRRFDFGPTDVYQALPRRNLTALGARSVSKFEGKQNLMIGYKSFWYQRAPQGVDDFIGHQVEARLRVQTTPSLRLEWGGAYLLKGEGFERGAYPDNSVYAYTAFLYKF